ncbi:MAG: ribonuclease III, partial [Flavobacteriales bacterium]|nr:ribonuclease III [Flavobacteriales bacterium]
MILVKKLIKLIPSLYKNKEGIFIFFKNHYQIEIKEKEHYKSALVHSSYNINNNYEKLEFLGDAILNTVVSEHLFLKHSKEDEGYFSKKRSLIIGRKNLNKIGRNIIPLSEIKHKLKSVSDNIFGNILESIIGAIYLDLGYNESKKFIFNQIIE